MKINSVASRSIIFFLLLGLTIVYSPSQPTSKAKTKASSAQWRGGSGSQPENQGKDKKEYPKLEGKEECFNYRRAGKKINCACSHQCDLDKGDPDNRYIVPGEEDYKCSNHCKKHMCKCKTKCQT